MIISTCVKCYVTLYLSDREDDPLKGLWVDSYDYQYCRPEFDRTGNKFAHTEVDTYERSYKA